MTRALLNRSLVHCHRNLIFPLHAKDAILLSYVVQEGNMGHREDMLDVIRSAYAARDDGDVEGLVAAFQPDGLFTLLGDKSALELTGSMQGHPTLRAAFGQLIADFGFERREILSELVDGNRAAVHSRVVVRHHPTGNTFSTEIMDLFRFQDGKIAELIEFADTAQIKAMIS